MNAYTITKIITIFLINAILWGCFCQFLEINLILTMIGGIAVGLLVGFVTMTFFLNNN
jgi:hypothetical protein